MTQPLVVIGAGLAGWTTVREFRKLDTQTPVVLVTADSGDFYAKPSLSNAFAQGKRPAQLVNTPAARMAETLGVTLLPQTRVQTLDTAAKTVTTSAGVIAYSQLVLATGAQPIRVPVEGDAADQVLSVNSLEDFSTFHDQLQAVNDHVDGRRPHVLIMGAGLIGCEFANDLASAGYRVSLVDPGSRPLAALLPEAASAQLREALAQLDVAFHFGSTVRAVNAGRSDMGALDISLSNGQLVRADRVLSAIGLRADTVLAKAAGLAVERGIVVNARLQTSAPAVHALGDCTQYHHGATLPFVMPIMSSAKVLAATLAGQPAELTFPLMPVSVKTPALPLVIAPPPPGSTGQWLAPEAGLWQWLDDAGRQRGFVLSGAQTSQRLAQSKQVAL
ncbi:FAD-dependent oxidoreductase [Polaromonas sp.]|uniref:FAD-dependent oxidoreductase n=1 Tax=Polaromonas sp. TaxID=1869339 RepID=UPI002FC6B901